LGTSKPSDELLPLLGIRSQTFLLQGFHALGFSDFSLSVPSSSILAVMVSPCIDVGSAKSIAGNWS
jgi:hypothetical protein